MISKEKLNGLVRFKKIAALDAQQSCVAAFKLKTFLFLFLAVAGYPATADEITLKDGKKIQGIILSEDATEVALQIAESWQVFPRGQIQSVQKWDERKNVRLTTSWDTKGFWDSISEAVRGGPSGILKFLKPHHYRLMRSVYNTPVYHFVMQVEALRKYKKDNPIGFHLSIYCILILLGALCLRIIKEVFWFVWSLIRVNFFHK